MLLYIGDFSYEMGSSGWTDTSIGNQAWELKLEYNDTMKGEKSVFIMLDLRQWFYEVS